MKDFFDQYRKYQQTLADIDYVASLISGSEWALKQNRKDHYKSFWLVEIAENKLIYNLYDGGGHCKEKKIALKEFENILGQTVKERADWLAAAKESCKKAIEKKKEDYEDSSLNSNLECMKLAILEKDKESAQFWFDELMKKVS